MTNNSRLGIIVLALASQLWCVHALAQAGVPQFTFDYPDTVYTCISDTYVLEIRDVQPGYHYQWYRNGTPLSNDTLSSYTVTGSGRYHARVRADGGGLDTTRSVFVWLYPLDKPDTRVTDILVCEGRTRTLTVSGYPDAVSMRWYRDHVLLPNERDVTLRVSEAGDYHVEMSLGSCSVESDVLSIQFVAPPVAQIEVADEGPLCHGTATVLTAVHPADGAYTYRWSTGETSRSIEVRAAGVYTLTLSNAAGCSDETGVTVTVSDPVDAPHIPDTVVCPVERQPVRLSAPTGYAAYEWSGGISLGADVEISLPGTYTLRVQDANGCWATTSFVVRQSCAEITIPNTFSPNGDGINDVWTISGLEYDPQSEVFVVDRNGREVFRSRGTANPWDGTFKGRLVPVGGYYYSISTSGGEHHRGSVTVLY